MRSFGGDEARGLRDVDRQALEALGKRLEVLACEQRGRHDDRDLHPVQSRDERSAESDLRFAEADVAAHEAIHRAAGGEIGEHRFDALRLIFGFFVGEAGDEFVPGAGRRRDGRRFLELAQRCDLDQFAGDLAQAVLEAGLA